MSVRNRLVSRWRRIGHRTALFRFATGQRKDKKTGDKIPRMILNKFVCKYNGNEVFASDWHPAIAANPYLAFYVKAADSGTLEMVWTDDKGQSFETSAKVNVTG